VGSEPNEQRREERTMAKKDKSSDQKSSKVWGLMSLVSGLAAAAVAKKALDKSWRLSTGKQPPANPADPDISMREAAAWAAVSGTFVALAKMLATRRAAHYYRRSTGELPPGLRHGEG
jgi:Protein of unknown function (DUF4235)